MIRLTYYVSKDKMGLRRDSVIEKIKSWSKKTKIIVGVVLAVIILAVIGSFLPKDEQTELKPLNIATSNYHVTTYQDAKYLYIDVEVENPNNEPINFDYYFRLKTPGGNVFSETSFYKNDNACKNFYKKDIEGKITCKLVFEVVTVGSYELKLHKAKFLNYELIATTKFKLDENYNATTDD